MSINEIEIDVSGTPHAWRHPRNLFTETMAL